MAGASLLYSTVYGAPCTLEINADGNLAGTAGYAGEDCDSGHWWLEDDRWYRQWRQWAYGEATGYEVVGDGDQMRFYGEDGFHAARKDVGEGKGGSVRVDLGGSGISKKKKKKN